MVSGGMDSTVLLHLLASNAQNTPLHAVSFNYGQRHSRELDCAVWQCERVGVDGQRVIDISFMGELLRAGTTLVSAGDDVPDFEDLSEESLDQPPTYVPNRNMMLLSMAAAYAESLELPNVYYAAQALDEYGYWDCTADFVDRLNSVFVLNRRDAVSVRAPFVSTKKSAIVARGLELGVDFAHTWSCYRGLEKACGKCPSCVERLKAFREAGAEDPIAYAV